MATLVSPLAASAAGFAHNDDFIVLTSGDDALAQAIMAKASEFRVQLAKQWLGEELAHGANRAKIYVGLSLADDVGFFWPIDNANRTLHSIHLKTSPERALDSTLRHEIAHLVLTSHLGVGALPPWADEGIASLEDDAARQTRGRRLVRQAAAESRANLRTLLDAQTIAASDQLEYAMAASLVEFLVARGERAEALKFAILGKQRGWDAAARQSYGFAGIAALETAWRQWVSTAKD